MPNINGGQIGGRRNLVINGSMKVAQRATSTTTSGYGSVDRWQHEYSNIDENLTWTQSDVVSSDSGDNPFAKGLTTCMKVINGNQTSGLQSNTIVNFNQNFEATDMRNSGWNYNSDSSFLTLTYYIKSSVADTFYGFVKTQDGTNRLYRFNTGALSANTWTKITKTIPGNSNLQIDDDNTGGFQVFPFSVMGTDYTASGLSEETWVTWNSAERSLDQGTSWWGTNDSTLEITGVQLEVGATATPFEHRTYADELRLCQRYFQVLGGSNGSYDSMATGSCASSTVAYVPHRLLTPMRATPSFTLGGSASDFRYSKSGDQTPSGLSLDQAGANMVAIRLSAASDHLATDAAIRLFNVNTTGHLKFEAEL